jgi:uncharacterized protein (TIGR02271 family)
MKLRGTIGARPAAGRDEGRGIMAKEQFQGLIRDGMEVVSADGEKLGKVTRVMSQGFEIEKGIFFRRECEASFDDVIDVRGKDIFLSATKAELERREGTRGEAASVPQQGVRAPSAASVPQQGVRAPSAGEEVRVPLVEEEVVAKKRTREAGEVRVTKETITEEKQVTVPVQRDVVRVERVPVSGEPARAEGAFKEESVTIPLRQEEVELEKRPVVKEEVVISKESREGTETAATSVRKERLDVEATGDLKEREVEPREEPRLRKAG